MHSAHSKFCCSKWLLRKTTAYSKGCRNRIMSHGGAGECDQSVFLKQPRFPPVLFLWDFGGGINSGEAGECAMIDHARRRRAGASGECTGLRFRRTWKTSPSPNQHRESSAAIRSCWVLRRTARWCWGDLLPSSGRFPESSTPEAFLLSG